MTINRRKAISQLALFGLATSVLRPQDASADTTVYIYDALGRLVGVSFDGGANVAYTYDAAGNRTQVARVATTFSSTITISGTSPVNLRTLANAAGYNGVQNATITFNVVSGAVIKGAAGAANGNPGGIAIDSGYWPPGLAISLSLVVKNGATVYGGGGGGAKGAGDAVASPAGIGGDAICCRIPMSVTVESGGVVKAGGGGGGGGQGWKNPTVLEEAKNGGGGGGGFPNGIGGSHGSNPEGTGEATDGANGTTSGGGLGGHGDALSDGHSGGSGGNGGGAASSGANGGGGSGTGTGGWSSLALSSGAVAGYAVRKNGNTVTVTNSGTIAGTVG